jgi:hypothetical protein
MHAHFEAGFDKAAAKIPKFVLKGLDTASKSEAHRLLRKGLGSSSHSLVGDVVKWPIQKAFGKKKTQKALWQYLHRPVMYGDIAAGNLARKMPGGKKMFTAREWVKSGPKTKKLVERASVAAPLGKLRPIAEPVIMGVGLDQIAKKLQPEQKKAMDKQAFIDKIAKDQELRKKAAQTMLKLADENKGHRKRAHATRLFYRQVELGQEEIPRSYSVFQEKIATLMKNEDLRVLEKALEMVGGNEKIGEIGRTFQAGSLSASEAFQSAILDLESF